jgi:hypothetical protein
MKNIALPYAVMRFEEPIVSIIFKEKAQLGFVEMRELKKNAENLSGGKCFYTICYLPSVINLTPLGKKVVSDIRETPLNKATAIVIKDNSNKQIPGFINKLKRSKLQIRMFANGEEAREWLLSLNDHHQEYNATG